MRAAIPCNGQGSGSDSGRRTGVLTLRCSDQMGREEGRDRVSMTARVRIACDAEVARGKKTLS
jgi:hypothetical protein